MASRQGFEGQHFQHPYATYLERNSFSLDASSLIEKEDTTNRRFPAEALKS